MNFQELGLTLQREREKKGLSIEVVMEATKISRINIVALEEGDRSSLPHPVYTKGFVKSYARLLGLDADELSMIVDREYQDEDQEIDESGYDVSPAVEKAFHEADHPQEKTRSIWPALIIGVLLIAAVVLLLMNLNSKNQESASKPVDITEPKQETAVVEEPVVPEVKQEPVVDMSEESQEQSSVSTTESSEKASDAKIPTPAPEASKPEVQKKTEVVKQAAKKVEAKPEKQKYDHVLIIRATTEKGCWIGVWRGDETDMARDFVLKEGEPLRLMFNNPRRIRIGNAAGVSVTYNGQPYPLNNAKGNIQTLRFGMN